MISLFEMRLALLSLNFWRRLHFLRSWGRCWLMKVSSIAYCFLKVNNCAILMFLIKTHQVLDHRLIKLKGTMHCSTQMKTLHRRSCNCFPLGFSCSIRIICKNLIPLAGNRSLPTPTRILLTSLVDGQTSRSGRKNKTILRPSGVWWVTLLFASTPFMYQPFQ